MGVAKKVIDAHRGAIEVTAAPAPAPSSLMSIPLADAMRDETVNANANPRPAQPR